MANFKDVMDAEREAEDALQRAYGTVSHGMSDSDPRRAMTGVGYGLIAVGRCILALGIRLDHIIRETS